MQKSIYQRYCQQNESKKLFEDHKHDKIIKPFGRDRSEKNIRPEKKIYIFLLPQQY